MHNSYFLKSKSIGFRTWSPDDLDIAIKIWGDLSVTKYVGGSFTHPKIQRRLLIERAIERQHNIQYWPMFLLATNEPVGYCGLRPYKPTESVFEIGILLMSDFWGKGYGEEAAQTVIDYAFIVLKANALFAVHNANNIYSKILLLKLGFKYSHDEYSASTGQYDPSYILSR